MDSILVTAVGNLGVGNQIVNCLRICNCQNYYIVGTDMYQEHINCIEMLDEFYILPDPRNERYFMEICRIIDKHKIQLIFVSTIGETYQFYQHLDYFNKKGIHIVLDSKRIFDLCMNKSRLFDYLRSKKIYLPRYKLINTEEDCNNIDFFPLVLKPNNNASSSSFVWVVFDKEDLYLLSRYMLKHEITPIAQEWKGNSKNEYSVSITSEKDRGVIGSIVMHRDMSATISYKERYTYDNKKYVISSGITQGAVVHNADLCMQAERIAKEIGSSKSLNLQGIWDEGVFWLIDAHPAITSSCYMKALAGYNEPEFWVQFLLHNRVIAMDYENIKLSKEIIVRRT